MNRIPEVAISVETDSTWGRQLVLGIADFAARHGPWHLVLEPLDRKTFDLLDRWQGEGVITKISTPLQLEQLGNSQIPTVDVGDILGTQNPIPCVRTNSREVAKLALEHFRERGFRSFGYFAPPSRDYSKQLGIDFVSVTTDAGFSCSEYRPGYRVGRNIRRAEQQKRVQRWLDQLPKPTAVLAIDARRGRQLAELCRLIEVPIPDEIAILAGDSDELFCELCSPPLSSVVVASHEIGFQAAATLQRLMAGEPVAKKCTEVAPLGISKRQSTDLLAVDDPMVVKALRYIQAHAYSGILVADVLEQVPISRRFLERQFQQFLGRSPAEEIRRLRLERGCALLTDSELSIEEVAQACGYAGATQFGAAFRKQFQMTPLAYRKRASRSRI